MDRVEKSPTWKDLRPTTRINILSVESTVEANLLLEVPELVEAVRLGKSREECLQIVNNSF